MADDFTPEEVQEILALLEEAPIPEAPSIPIPEPPPIPVVELTLTEARQRFWLGLEQGIDCPLCERHAKVYKRKLNSGMARILIRIYRLSCALPAEADGWMHVSHIFLQDRQNAVAQEYSKLRFWGLLEERPNTNPETPGSGYWRVTALGRDFVRGLLSVPRRVFVYDNRCLGVSDERTTIQEALGDAFNYDELMRGAPTGEIRAEI